MANAAGCDRFVIAMFHPAAALHQAALKPAILKDFGQLPKLLEQARTALKHFARGRGC